MVGGEGYLHKIAALDESVCEDFNKVGHGLVVGDVVRHSGANPEDFVKAQSDTIVNSEAIGVVSSVTGDDFTICYSGRINGLSGLTTDEVHFLSDSTAGALTITEPTISKPILFATSATSAVINIMREVDATTSGGGKIKFGSNSSVTSGKWMELHRNITSNDVPYTAANAETIVAFSVRVKNPSTITFGIYKNGLQIDTLTLTSQIKNNKIGLSHSLAALDEISVKVESGSAQDAILFIHE